jgi:hypothetical protein
MWIHLVVFYFKSSIEMLLPAPLPTAGLDYIVEILSVCPTPKLHDREEIGPSLPAEQAGESLGPHQTSPCSARLSDQTAGVKQQF